jgi:clan AA aspartic protease (TIGR02281 family)
MFRRATVLSLLFAFGSLSQTPTKQKKLRECPKNDSSIVWDNCIGSTWYDNGSAHYVGEFHSGKFNGKGTITSANGSFQYVGDFLADHANGQGTITYANGDKYVGEFRDDVKNGRGTYTFANGNTYVGEFRDNKMTGQGTETWTNGTKYAGEFSDGQLSGQGTMTYANGTTVVGQFNNGQFVGPLSNPKTAEQPKSSGFEVRLERQAGVLTVPVTINGRMLLDFIIDSGASDVSIPADVVSTLWRTGTLADADFTGSKTYVLADGSTMPSATFRIRSLQVGEKLLENISGSVAPSNGALLLGQSFLSRFKSWSVDNVREVLVLH